MRSSLTRRQRTAVERLERSSRNEDLHTRHVTRLALTLFDGTRDAFALTASDRQLLELAARLHDIGYARAPLRHVRAGAARLLRSRSLGLPPSARRQLAALVLLHSQRDYRAGLAHPVFRALPERARILRLAAFLRVADGLDNGHVQDAEITRVRPGPRKVSVRVRTPCWPRNLLAARRKSDLWHAAWPLPLQLKAAPAGKTRRLVRRDLPAAEAVRRLLSLEYRAFMATVEDTGAGDPEALHDARVALRRARLLLRAFAPVLPAPAAGRAQRELKRVADALGPARDLDVWGALLPRGSAAGRRLAARRKTAQASVRRVVSGRSLDQLRRALGLLLRVELARLRARAGGPSAGRQADRAVRAAARRARHRLQTPAGSPAARHRLRLTLRRVVLLCSMLAALREKPRRRAIRALRRTERALGRLHDVESLPARIADAAARRILEACRIRRQARVKRRLGRREVSRALRALG